MLSNMGRRVHEHTSMGNPKSAAIRVKLTPSIFASNPVPKSLALKAGLLSLTGQQLNDINLGNMTHDGVTSGSV